MGDLCTRNIHSYNLDACTNDAGKPIHLAKFYFHNESETKNTLSLSSDSGDELEDDDKVFLVFKN